MNMAHFNSFSVSIYKIFCKMFNGFMFSLLDQKCLTFLFFCFGFFIPNKQTSGRRSVFKRMIFFYLLTLSVRLNPILTVSIQNVLFACLSIVCVCLSTYIYKLCSSSCKNKKRQKSTKPFSPVFAQTFSDSWIISL